MPLPSSINDLSTTAGSNSPAGSESPSTIDDYLRVQASYIARLRDSAQSNAFSMATAGGSTNAITATYSPAVVTPDNSTVLRFKATAANTGATTFSPNGITAAPIVGGNHAALQGGEIVATGDVWVQWNSSIGTGSWVLLESSGGGQQVAPATSSLHATTAGQAQSQAVTAFATAGVSATLTLTPVPAITAYAANQRFRVKFGFASTGTDTLNISGLGAKSLKQYDSTGAKVAAVFAANQLADVEYDGTDFVLLDALQAAPAWGAITGTLSAQTDLQQALDALSSRVGATMVNVNGGANLAVNQIYTVTNPFPNETIICEAQVLFSGVWANPRWFGTSGTTTYGTTAGQRFSTTAPGDIYVRTGTSAMTVEPSAGGSAFPAGMGNQTAIPCRVLVWRVKS